jgi:hypothetical protein
MNKEKELNQVTEQTNQNGSPKVDVRRRDLAKAGLAGGAILATLTSRPALGLECTDSLVASWNTSAHPELEKCIFACSPGFWKPKGGKPFIDCEWGMTAYTKGQLFHDIFFPGDALNDPFPGKTLEEVILKTAGGSKNLPAAGMHAVAGILNATHDFLSASYPFTVEDVIADFNKAYIKYKDAGYKPGKLRRLFLRKYDIYKQEGVACPLPVGICKPRK